MTTRTPLPLQIRRRLGLWLTTLLLAALLQTGPVLLPHIEAAERVIAQSDSVHAALPRLIAAKPVAPPSPARLIDAIVPEGFRLPGRLLRATRLHVPADPAADPRLHWHGVQARAPPPSPAALTI